MSRHHPSFSNQRETFLLLGMREMNSLNVDFDVVELFLSNFSLIWATVFSNAFHNHMSLGFVLD